MKIIIPDNAIKYILYQRTTYFNLTKKLSKTKIFIKMREWLPFLKRLDIKLLKSLILKNKTKQLFSTDIVKEYNIIKPYLPHRINSILDIGCGIAGIDVPIFKHYNENKNIDFCLLDKTIIDRELYYGFHNQGAFYNSLLVAKDLLMQNGIDEKKIFAQEVGSDFKILFNKKFDLVISLLSWGYHYPVSTYLKQVFELIKPQGCLIMDVRKGKSGEFEVKQKFKNLKRISEIGNRITICAIKKN